MKTTKKNKHEQALREIARMTWGMKDSSIDWANVGKRSVGIARDTIAGKCKCCGKQKEYLIP